MYIYSGISKSDTQNLQHEDNSNQLRLNEST